MTSVEVELVGAHDDGEEVVTVVSFSFALVLFFCRLCPRRDGGYSFAWLS